MAQTPNFNLYVYGTEIINVDFIEYLKNIAGDNNSNMTIIDDVLKELFDSIGDIGTVIDSINGEII